MVDKSVISALWVCKCAGFDSLQFPHLNLSSSLRSWQNSLSRPILQNPQMTRILTRLILVSLVGKIHHWLVRRLSMINILEWGFWCSGGQCCSASTTLLNQFRIGSLYCCHDWLTDTLWTTFVILYGDSRNRNTQLASSFSRKSMSVTAAAA